MGGRDYKNEISSTSSDTGTGKSVYGLNSLQDYLLVVQSPPPVVVLTDCAVQKRLNRTATPRLLDQQESSFPPGVEMCSEVTQPAPT